MPNSAFDCVRQPKSAAFEVVVAMMKKCLETFKLFVKIGLMES